MRAPRRTNALVLLAMSAVLGCADTTGLPPTSLPGGPQFQHTSPPSSMTIAGSFQSELGCPGDWQPECAQTHLSYDGADDVWQGAFDVPAGDWEYKAALNDSWDENYGLNATRNGANIPLSLGGPSAVKFYYSHETHWVTSNRNAVIATVPGSFQSEVGCAGDWDPGCLRSWLQDPDGDGTYSFVAEALPTGSYEAKVAINETWDENYGAGGVQNGPNIPFSVSGGSPVTFSYNSVTHVLTITTTSANQPPAATFSAPASVTEGSSFALALTDPVDSPADLDAGLMYAFDCGEGNGYGPFGSDNAAACPTSDDAVRAVGGRVRDQHDAESEYTATVVVQNVAPVVSDVPGATILAGETFMSSGGFTDPGADTWTATVDYGDGSGAQPLALDGQGFALSHVYSVAGSFGAAVVVTDDDGGAGSGEAEVVVLSPQQGSQVLMDMVDALAGSGALSAGEAGSLTAKLRAADQQLERGNAVAATNQIRAFINQVNALVRSGRLSESEGASLIDYANRLIASINR